MLDNYTMPAHYKQLQIEMEALIVKIRDTLDTRTSSSSPLDNFSQVAMLPNGEQIAQFASCFNSFASKILSEFTASPLIVKSALEDLKFELFSCLSKYRELCSRGFPQGYEEGHGLLIAVSKRLLEQILEVCENIVKFMNSLGQNQKMSGNNRISLYVKLNNDAEVARYVAWTERVQQQLRESNSSSKFPNFFLYANIFLFSLFRKRHRKSNTEADNQLFRPTSTVFYEQEEPAIVVQQEVQRDLE